MSSTRKPAGTEDLAGPGRELAEVPGAQRRKDDADRPGLPTGECRGEVGCREIEPVGGLDDAFPGRWADAGDAAQRTRDRPLIDTGFPRDVSNRRTPSRRLRPRRNDPACEFRRARHQTIRPADGSEQPFVVPLTRGIVQKRALTFPQSRAKRECRGSLDHGCLGEEAESMAAVLGRWRATYTPGDWVVLSGPTSLVMLEPPTHEWAPLINTLWDEVVASSSIVDLAARLASFKIDALPSFGAFFWTADGMRSLVRGHISVIDLATGKVVADGEGIQTWSEVGLAGVSHIRVDTPHEGDATLLELPLVVGAVRASSVVLDASERAQVSSPQGEPTSAGAPGPGLPTEPLPEVVAAPSAEPAHQPASGRGCSRGSSRGCADRPDG